MGRIRQEGPEPGGDEEASSPAASRVAAQARGPSGLSGLFSHLVDTGSRPPCDPPTLGGTLGHLSMRLPLCYALTSASSASCS